MHPMTAQFLAADRIATLRRAAEAGRLGRLARPSRRARLARVVHRIAALALAQGRTASPSTPPASY